MVVPDIGTIFGRWTVTGPERRTGKYNRVRLVPCRCECGTERTVQLRNLHGGTSRGCSRCGQSNKRKGVRARDRIGQRFGRLVVRAALGKGYMDAECDCGHRTRALIGNMVSGMTRSCGCLSRERTVTHGLSSDPLYYTWIGMLQRCNNPNQTSWVHYGGRGIAVCAAWATSFPTFLTDMGPKPTPAHSIDRVENDGGYWCGKCEECVRLSRPANCRWATAKEQANNQRIARDAVLLTFNGETLPCAQWAARCGVSRQRIQQKLAAGYPIERILAPKQKIEAKRYSFLGVNLTLREWSRRLGLNQALLEGRAHRGLTGERLFSLNRLKVTNRRPSACSRCGTVGHYAKTCPQRKAA